MGFENMDFPFLRTKASRILEVRAPTPQLNGQRGSFRVAVRQPRVAEKRGDMPANGASGAYGASGVLQPRVEFQTSRASLATRTRPVSLIPIAWELSPAKKTLLGKIRLPLRESISEQATGPQKRIGLRPNPYQFIFGLRPSPYQFSRLGVMTGH